MSAASRSGSTTLPRHVSISLHDRAGDRIECVAGVLWITQDRDPRDIVLRAGESFRLDRNGRTVVFALADARFALHRAAPGKALAPRLLTALRGWLAPAPAQRKGVA
jgi:hypothetical protein